MNASKIRAQEGRRELGITWRRRGGRVEVERGEEREEEGVEEEKEGGGEGRRERGLQVL